MEKEPSPSSASKSAATKATQARKTKTSQASKKLTTKRKRRLPRSKYSHDELVEIFARFKQQRAEPEGELEHVNPYTLVVAVALSAQATDKGVNAATRALFKIADTPEKMLALGLETVGDYIKTIGLWRNKAKNVIALSQMLVDEFGSIVPQTREELMRLPGVGRKTANVVMSMAFGIPTMAVDTHVFRIGHRMGMAPGKDPDEVEAILMKVIPEDYLFHAHHWLILHGRYTCVARKPKCEQCIIADLCKSKERTCQTPAEIVPLNG